jgi:Zn-dependent peptidase ImmA (M78 family)/transcriptional regulator with XRE-family HTH domain
MAQGEQINPKMLFWGRETAGLSIEEAAEKLGLKDTAKARGVDKLRALEAGERSPSRTQLLRAAAAYRRPLIAFYLPEPPRRGQRGEDFRTVSGAVSARDNGILDALLRDLRARQQMLREVLQDEDEARPLPFVASARMEQGAATVAGAIRTALGVTEEDQRFAKGPAGLFTLLREAAERIGVYVLLAGDLGSYHSDISEEVFRGVALADDVAPFVVINDNDATPARAFTLVHEMAHIWTGASGVSGPLRGLPDNVIERFCNDVAGEFLLPSGAVADLSHLRGASVQVVLGATERLAEVWNVSQGAVTYRFAQKNWILPDVASHFVWLFAGHWRREKQRTRATRSPDEMGPSYHVVRRNRLGAALLGVVRRNRLGAALLGVVRRALQGETITHTKAARILGVSPSSVEQLLQGRGAHAA